jgi:DnaJ domain
MISLSISNHAKHHFFALSRLSRHSRVQNNDIFTIGRRGYFTNTDTMKHDDPYAQLGLRYGDGATLTDIKQAYKQKSLLYHPDLQQDKQAQQEAARKFQDLQRAYQTLVNVHSNLNGLSVEKDEEWRVSVWRNGDRLAVNRTDVAGVLKKRPAPPATIVNVATAGLLGHPSGRGVSAITRGEYLTEDGGKIQSSKSSSSVGRGVNKWVQPKQLQPWNGQGGQKAPRASNFAKK